MRKNMRMYGIGEQIPNTAPRVGYNPQQQFDPAKRNSQVPDWSSQAPSANEQISSILNKGLGSGDPLTGMISAGVTNIELPAMYKFATGKVNDTTPMERASLGFFGLDGGMPGVVGGVQSFNKAKNVATEKKNNQKAINDNYNMWMNREQKAYDTKDFYQLAKYGGNINKYFMGGSMPGVPIEAEGNEAFMFPNGKMEQIQGPSHEQGGVKMKAAPGSKIYSNRIAARKDLVERLKMY